MAYGCHNCPHNAEIERLRKICIRCKRCSGDRVRVGSWTHVSIDAARDEACAEKMLSMTPPDYAPRRQMRLSRVAMPDTVLPYLLRIVEPVKLLNDKDLLLLAAMMRGERLADIARRTGVTLSAVHERWKKILRHNPIWRTLATGMIGSGRGRKPRPAAQPPNVKTGRADADTV